MRSGLSSSAARPSVRAKVSLEGLKLIVSPDLDGFEPARRGAEEALGDVREALGRVGHVEVVKVVAEAARVRPGLAQVAQLLRRRAAQALALDERFDGARRGLARVYQTHALAHRLLYHAPQDGVVRAAEDERRRLAAAQVFQVLLGHEPRHVGVGPALLGQRD